MYVDSERKRMYMTLLQIKYAVYCYNCESINKAAEQLITTPSNVSKTIKALESELGFSIFERSSSGIIPTSLGSKFIKYATSIIDICNQISNLASSNEDLSFSLCYNQVPFVKEAFNEFCSTVNPDTLSNIKLYQGNYYYCKDLISRNICKLGIISIFSGNASSVTSQLKAEGFTADLMNSPYACLVLREDHPILKGISDLTTESLLNYDFSSLTNYPYISYSLAGTSEEIVTPFNIGGDIWPVNPNKIIEINNMSQKISIIKSTNAYSFVSSSVDEVTTKDGIVIIPNPSFRFHIYSVYKTTEGKTPVCSQFLSCLEKQIRESSDAICE